VLLNLRLWNHPDYQPLRGVRVAQRSRATAVDRAGPVPRVRLDVDLSGVPRETEVTLQAIGFPASTSPETHRAELRLPPQPLLEFGVGVREECWGPEAATTRFELTLSDDSGNATSLFERKVDATRSGDRRWFDAQVDLSRWTGQRVALTFRATSGPGCALPAWSDPVLRTNARANERPNIVIVSVDTLRARSLGAYGYGRDTSPFLDSVAARGTLFTTASTTSVTTAPSHMSLFTGQYPVQHGIRRGNENKASSVPTLAESLRAAQYQSVAFTENGYLLRARGFGDGFSRYTENRAASRAGVLTGETTDARVTFAQTREWLETGPAEPFFAFVHTYEVHSPYRARSPHARRFAEDDYPGPELAAVRAERDNYDREIRIVDDELRTLFDALEARGLADRTLVVVLADHGEQFHEHGLLQHGGDLFEETLHVPLIFVGPGIGARRIRGPVSLIDVAPTLLELVGIEVPTGLDGRSLVDAFGSGKLPERRLFAEAASPRRWVDLWRFESWNPPLISVRSGDTKFLVHRPTSGKKNPTVRFDLAADPLERAPIPVDGALLTEVEAWVDAYLGAKPAPGVHPQIMPDERDRLRALGYGE
jgi:arylsulfatase A-like enzyme